MTYRLQFRQCLAQADSGVVYPVLKWVLSQADNLSKRAFVGYYMTPVLMPDELALDQEVAGIRSEIMDLQQQFVQLHKAREAQISLKRYGQFLLVCCSLPMFHIADASILCCIGILTC